MPQAPAIRLSFTKAKELMISYERKQMVISVRTSGPLAVQVHKEKIERLELATKSGEILNEYHTTYDLWHALVNDDRIG